MSIHVQGAISHAAAIAAARNVLKRINSADLWLCQDWTMADKTGHVVVRHLCAQSVSQSSTDTSYTHAMLLQCCMVRITPSMSCDQDPTQY